MRSVSIRLSDLDGGNKLIPIGFVGENEYTTINIDCKKVFDQHPNAVPALAVTPPQGDSYPAIVVRDGDIISWTVCDSDLIYEGSGALQLTFVIDGTVIGKTYKARTKVLGSIEPSGEVPTPIANWLIQAAAALQGLPQQVSDNVLAVLGAMIGVGQTLDSDENVTVSYDANTNTLTIGVPKGKDGTDGHTPVKGVDYFDGQDGHTPVISAQKVGKVTTFYVDGVAIATVNDGQDGAGIDDTTKSTTSTWSSKKIDDENSALKTEIAKSQPTATNSDIGKFIKLKSIDQNGKPTEFEYGEGGGSVDPAVIAEAVDDWLDDHPEATTTVQDGAITYQKLDSDLQGIADCFDDTAHSYSSSGTSGYYRLDNGVITKKSSSSWSCEKIEVEDWMGMVVSFTINAEVGNPNAVYCGFTDANDSFLYKNEYVIGYQELLIPKNAKYIYFSHFGQTYVSAYSIKPSTVVMSADLNKLGISAEYDGKDGVAFGTSITYKALTTYGYLQYLPTLCGMSFDNQGVGSSTIYGDGGNLDMLAKIKAYTGYASKKVCLLEGFINDWYGNKPLGTWKDNTETSVCGCVRSALNYITSQNAYITVFLILDHYGKNQVIDCRSTAVNSSSLTQYEYYDEIAKVAHSLGIPVIKMYAESQISENTPQYLIDNIHPTSLGAKHTAYFIWSKMKQYYLNRVN